MSKALWTNPLNLCGSESCTVWRLKPTALPSPSARRGELLRPSARDNQKRNTASYRLNEPAIGGSYKDISEHMKEIWLVRIKRNYLEDCIKVYKCHGTSAFFAIIFL